MPPPLVGVLSIDFFDQQVPNFEKNNGLKKYSLEEVVKRGYVQGMLLRQKLAKMAQKWDSSEIIMTNMLLYHTMSALNRLFNAGNIV